MDKNGTMTLARSTVLLSFSPPSSGISFLLPYVVLLPELATLILVAFWERALEIIDTVSLWFCWRIGSRTRCNSVGIHKLHISFWDRLSQLSGMSGGLILSAHLIDLISNQQDEYLVQHQLYEGACCHQMLEWTFEKDLRSLFRKNSC